MGKTGRNEPCPCGSGKKFKFCCGKNDNIIPFPAVGMSEEPFLGTKLVDSEELADIRRDFGAVIEGDNSAPVDDFLGLSPNQMHNILGMKFAENTEIVEFKPIIEWTDVEAIPFLNQAVYLLNELQKEQPLPTTKNGNLPRNLVQRIYEAVVKEHLLNDDIYPQKESDIPEIERLRHVLDYSGLIKKRSKAFSLTKVAESMLAQKDWSGIYNKIFGGYSFSYLWAYEDRYPDLWIVQHALLFDLYLLKELAGDYVSGEDLGLAFSRAFPAALAEAEGYQRPEVTLAHCFTTRFLLRYGEPMGLVTSEPVTDKTTKLASISTKYRTTPLFHRIFDWHVEG